MNVIVVYGPTASGKTALSLELAERFGGEVVSADSRQIFREMEIGTGKIKPEEMRGIPHHCLDLADPSEDFSVALFVKAATGAMEDIASRGKTVIVCGGTGLYLDALLFEFDVPEVPPDKELRADLETFRLENGNEALWRKLEAVDPEYAAQIHPNNSHYVVRGLEVFAKTGKSKASFHTERKLKFENVAFATPYDGDRASLYARIDARVRKMFADGLFEEAVALMEKYGKTAFGMKCIGYGEAVRYLEGEFGDPSGKDSPAFEKYENLVAQNSRNYAKRQITWNKRYAGLPHLRSQ
ncbi:MAG: tRNA dimethylallyltransferase [Patescibacteria group bacterium]|nr:tRNA dimethylallyltransferase [Patescibacteria group bacterium]